MPNYRYDKVKRPSLGRAIGGETCPICEEHHYSGSYQTRYSCICKKCFDLVIDKLDDIFIYMLTHRKIKWLERRKFNKLEKFAWKALQEEIVKRAERRKKNRERVKIFEIDPKYSEERRILAKEW